MKSRSFQNLLAGLLGIAVLTAIRAEAATELDLVTNEQIDYNGAIFSQFPEDQPTGTGVYNPIVRINEDTAADGAKDGQSAGYNTSGRPVAFDELTDPNWTRDITLGEIEQVQVGEQFYYCFRLDINEPGNADATLSLDTIRIFIGDGGQTTSDVASLGVEVFNLDDLGDVYIKLDARLRDGGAPGSGTGDMEMLVPVSVFEGYADDANLILFSEFGLQAGNKQDSIGEQAGFEEWAACGEVIPEPTTGLLVGMALLSFVGIAKRRK